MKRAFSILGVSLVLCMLMAVFSMAGCGSGGYNASSSVDGPIETTNIGEGAQEVEGNEEVDGSEASENQTNEQDSEVESESNDEETNTKDDTQCEEQWAAYDFDSEVESNCGNSGKVSSFVIREIYDTGNNTKEFIIEGEYGGIETTTIKTVQRERSLGCILDPVDTVIESEVECYKIHHLITSTENYQTEPVDWVEATIWIPTDASQDCGEYAYPKLEYHDSDGDMGIWSYFVTDQMKCEQRCPPRDTTISYLPHRQGEACSIDRTVLRGLYGYTLSWFSDYTKGGRWCLEPHSAHWSFGRFQRCYSSSPITQSIGDYSFNAWEVNTSKTGLFGITREYRGIFSPDLPIPIYLKIGASDCESSDYYEYELVDVVLS